MRTAIPCRNKKFARLIQQPDSAFICAGFGESMFDCLAHQRIEQRRELLGLKGGCNPFEAFCENGFQIQKGWIGKNVEALSMQCGHSLNTSSLEAHTVRPNLVKEIGGNCLLHILAQFLPSVALCEDVVHQ